MNIKYKVSEVVRAKWIRPRSENHSAWLITFNSDTLPEAINIPGEQTITKIYPYKDKPMMCRKCQQYSHLSKYCRAEVWTCGKCGGGHQTEECRNGILRCVNCEGNHWTGHSSCRKQMEEQEILDMQLKDKIIRGMA